MNLEDSSELFGQHLENPSQSSFLHFRQYQTPLVLIDSSRYTYLPIISFYTSYQ